MSKNLVSRLRFVITHPYESIIKRTQDYILIKKGVDFKSEFNLEKLGLASSIANPYESLHGIQSLKLVFKACQINQNDCILDFGSGKGEALFQLSKLPFYKVNGVELSSNLVDIASNNLNILKVKKFTIFHSNASLFKDLDEYNYFYMFNPFPEIIMKDVIANIEQSLIKNPRKIRIIYSNPLCHSVIEESLYIKKTNEYEIKHKDLNLKVFVYENQFDY